MVVAYDIIRIVLSALLIIFVVTNADPYMTAFLLGTVFATLLTRLVFWRDGR